MRAVIINADDFGLADEVNEAVELAHRNGVLQSASLMVAARATEDAVARARTLPGLAVGLHLVLVNGRSVLPPQRIPALVDERGNFRSHLFSAGVQYFFTRGVRRELEDEIRAQFERFTGTGLAIDHVNAQNHLHVHPAILSILMRVAREFRVRTVRVPYEPFLRSWRAVRSDAAARLGNAALLAPWVFAMQRRLRAGGFVTNDYVFGINDSGRMTADRMIAYLLNLPNGVSEIYVHPATRAWAGAEPPEYDFAGEYAALVDRGVIRCLASCGASPTTFGALAAAVA